MQVTIQSCGVDIKGDFETKIHRKIQLSLSRVESYITRLSIRLTSTGNERGTTHCLLTLVIANQSDIVIEDTQVNIESVIDRALQKASRIIERLVLPLE